MASKIAIAPQANLDLEQHFEYIAINDADSAMRFFDAVRSTFSQLAKNPGIGRIYEVKNPNLQGLRKWRVTGFEKYLIFYQYSEETLTIIRLIHGSRDIASILVEE
ncbi:type II toxin-antitoxin system RelE/ParE family toxin [Roseofilum reptotaenium CS-1145]|uniref:Plasmid stabilization system protein n=1 Tax=Roseofilum reptotaenium AO1-A TaxID=1925591 RepID=A0A1L9QWE4_9CYAN|nr:type II toxin-antitoxin system RelE/ParE family toxin [Roseofilum reptotaenium]MDB9518609.1 type II toxin-antitoxin system RelE/ParE family toxin [Roseofilum reptotaenium CS-1145]OJJ27000.1 plasmid stabilization system protein [Roseofilum reptotaenium AO1-A]